MKKKKLSVLLIVLGFLVAVICIFYTQYRQPTPLLTHPQSYEFICVHFRVSEDGDSTVLTPEQYETYGKDLFQYLRTCKKMTTFSKSTGYAGRDVDIFIGFHDHGKAMFLFLGNSNFLYDGDHSYIYDIADAEAVKSEVYHILHLDQLDLPWH